MYYEVYSDGPHQIRGHFAADDDQMAQDIFYRDYARVPGVVGKLELFRVEKKLVASFEVEKPKS